MQIVQYIPGAVGAAPAFHTLPTFAPDIAAVVGAEITRLPSALSAHGAGPAPVAHVPTAVPVGHAGADVAAHADHAHDLVFEANPAANAVTMAADSLRNASAGALTVTGGGADGGVQNQTIPAHVVTQPNNHLPADIVAAVGNHPAADIAGGLANHVGANPVVAVPTVTRLTTRTFTLDVATLVGDILTLAYLEVGERIAVS